MRFTTACRESSMLYQAADGSELPLLVFEPGQGTQPHAGIVLFHGGALRTGSADGLAPHCRKLASRGVFAVSAGYRLLGHGAASIDDCVADVRRAIEQFGRLAASRGLAASRPSWPSSRRAWIWAPSIRNRSASLNIRSASTDSNTSY